MLSAFIQRDSRPNPGVPVIIYIYNDEAGGNEESELMSRIRGEHQSCFFTLFSCVQSNMGRL